MAKTSRKQQSLAEPVKQKRKAKQLSYDLSTEESLAHKEGPRAKQNSINHGRDQKRQKNTGRDQQRPVKNAKKPTEPVEQQRKR